MHPGRKNNKGVEATKKKKKKRYLSIQRDFPTPWEILRLLWGEAVFSVFKSTA